MADDLGIEDYVKKNFPKGVSVPTEVSEDEAVRAVQEQFTKAGFDCPDETARGIVRHAWAQAGEQVTFYGLAELDSKGQPIKYLPPMGETWQPGWDAIWLTTNRDGAWRLATRPTAEELAEVIAANPGNQRLEVIELDWYPGGFPPNAAQAEAER